MLQSARFVTLDDGRRLRVFDSGPVTARDARAAPSGTGAPGARPGADSSPLIVLEPGLGAGGRSWAGVFHRLAPFARVIAYDRAGYGASDPVDAPSRSLTSLRDDLLAVIDDAERGAANTTTALPAESEPGAGESDTGGPDASESDAVPLGRSPIVLVGHSWGGPIVRAAAAARRAAGRRVDGIVLADPSDEGCELYFGPTSERINRVQARLMVPLARLGMLRPMSASAYAGLPRRQRRDAARDGSTISAARAASAETAAFFGDLAALRTAPIDLTDVPVRIVSGVRADLGVRAMRDALREAHRASAASVTDGQFVDAPNSAHGVPFTDPQLIADTALALARA